MMALPPPLSPPIPVPFLQASLLVAAGGGFGAWLRLGAGRLVSLLLGPAALAFPWATLLVNVLGSLLMGVLAGWLLRHAGAEGGTAGESWRLLLGVGVLGGFTTFSAFALEFATFVQRGALGLAAAYVAASLIAGFGALFAGLWLVRA